MVAITYLNEGTVALSITSLPPWERTFSPHLSGKKICQLQQGRNEEKDMSAAGPWRLLSLWAFLIVTFYADAPHLLSIECCLLKRHQGAKVFNQELMKWNSSFWPQRSGNKMLTVL